MSVRTGPDRAGPRRAQHDEQRLDSVASVHRVAAYRKIPRIRLPRSENNPSMARRTCCLMLPR